MREWLIICIISGVGWISFNMGVNYQKHQQCTEKCRVKELELQKESEEFKWRYELINDIKNK